MLLIPAIDLKDGHCVRLKQGDMRESTVFSEDPAAMARRWIDAGARRLHLVDLNGAFAGKPVNEGAVKAILAEVGDEAVGDVDGGRGEAAQRLAQGQARPRGAVAVDERHGLLFGHREAAQDA